jgi:carboxypeptidase Q
LRDASGPFGMKRNIGRSGAWGALCAGLAGCAGAAPASSPASSPSSPPPSPAISESLSRPAAAASASAHLAAPPSPLPVLVPEALRGLQAAILGAHGAVEVVSSLTTEVGGRLAGSPADKLAVAWAVRTMQARGFSNVHTEPVKVPVWQRGAEAAAIVLPVPHVLAITTLGWSGKTPSEGVVADVVRFDSLDALKSADPKSTAAKIVFLDVRMHAHGDSSGYGEAVVARAIGPEEASKKGAAAVVIRSIGSDDSRFPHTGMMHHGKEAATTLPAGAISNADADLLERVLDAHGSARLSLNLQPRWLPDAESANVVGDIVGRERPTETVLLGAHLDSWDLAEGAIDDGAGCGIVLEAGRAIGALAAKPRRTVRVVLFAAEENSLAGATQYAKAHAPEVGSMVAAAEADAGTGSVVRVLLPGAARLPMLNEALALLHVELADGTGTGEADITPLYALGVPMVGLRQDPARYFDTHHTAADTFARIDPKALTQAAAAFATVAWTLAEADGDLGRVPESDRAKAR